MEKCTRIGCGASFDPSNNTGADCRFHPGGPVFHEGLKSYSCCADTNKPVLTFDDFLAIPGCATGSHSSEQSEVKAPIVTAPGQKDSVDENTVAAPKADRQPVPKSTSNGTHTPPVFKSRPASPSTSSTGNTAATRVPDEDPEGLLIPSGARCKRNGCSVVFTSDLSRTDDECVHHPKEAVFHEGSKGYACCRPKVLEFDEFLKIQGCAKGKHCFVGRSSQRKEGEVEQVKCRHDMFQTPSQVICSIFGKQVDKEASTITFEEWTMHVKLVLPASKQFTQSYALYGPIDADKSSYRILGMKVEVTLHKADGRSWPALEQPVGGAPSSGRYGGEQITFGVQGRTGTVGAKEMIYAGDVVRS